MNTRTSNDATTDNPTLQPWEGPFGGVPAFDAVRVEHLQPGVLLALERARARIGTIAGRAEAPSFENTIEALEDAERRLARELVYYGVWESSLSGPEVQKVERELAPRLSAFFDEVIQNEALFRRIEAVQAPEALARLEPEARRLVWRKHLDFVLAGARLDPEAKQKLATINQRLASLYTDFGQNVLADEERRHVRVDSEDELDGLPTALRNAAAAEAANQGMPGKWLIANTRSAVEPLLTLSTRRALREKVWREFVARGDHPGEHDNNPIIAEILKLRAERARLIGFATHAHLQLADTMAKTPEATLELMQAVWRPALARVHEEVADMQVLAADELQGAAIEPWDYRYFAEKVRKARYDLDDAELSPYLQLDKLREALFWVAEKVCGLRFVPADDVPVFHPDVKVWEVRRIATDAHVGLWYFDPYARAGKRSGAWMSSYRDQARFAPPSSALVSNNANFLEPSGDEPVLVSWDDAVTMFHEFGHALHGLSSNVHYPSLSGTNVPRDYVEFPSQLFERWLLTPEVLQRFALHVKTGEPMPASLIAKIERAQTFNQGFATVEYLATAWVDMKAHLAGSAPIDPRAFEAQTLAELGMPAQIVMRHRMPQLAHVFSGDGYSAGYYSYLWAEVLSADAFEAFREAGGPYDEAVAGRLVRHVLSVGNSSDPEQAYRAFRGKAPSSDALMRKRGFAKPLP